jgi:hypothetical protein
VALQISKEPNLHDKYDRNDLSASLMSLMYFKPLMALLACTVVITLSTGVRAGHEGQGMGDMLLPAPLQISLVAGKV